MRHVFWAFLLLGCRTAPTENAARTPDVPVPVDAGEPAPAPAPSTDEVALPIPARAQAAESPPSGWCGETAIQEALLHLGIWAPQRLINRAGHPAHPDLYSNELPGAIAAFGVTPRHYSGPRGYDAFARWSRRAIDAGAPVLAGVKLVPTEHPEWGLDHFVLVVGHGPKGLLVNTTWGRREWIGRVDAKAVADAKAAGTQRISFENAGYGMRLEGPPLPDGALPARITLTDETSDAMKATIACSGAPQGGRLRVEERSSPRAREPVRSLEIRGREVDVMLAKDDVAYFRCVPVP